jgi:hypothetical protein
MIYKNIVKHIRNKIFYISNRMTDRVINYTPYQSNKVVEANQDIAKRAIDYRKKCLNRKTELQMIREKSKNQVEYFSDSSDEIPQKSKSNKNEQNPYNRRVLQYISALNTGKLKKANREKLIEYEIIFNTETKKYQKDNISRAKHSLTKLIEDYSHLWTREFNPIVIQEEEINRIRSNNPDLKNTPIKDIWGAGFNPEIIIKNAIYIKLNEMK